MSDGDDSVVPVADLIVDKGKSFAYNVLCFVSRSTCTYPFNSLIHSSLFVVVQNRVDDLDDIIAEA